MTQWSNIQFHQRDIDLDTLAGIYEARGFSMILREDFAEYIESKCQELSELPKGSRLLANFLKDFVEEVQRSWEVSRTSFGKKREHQKALATLQTHYGSDPAQFFVRLHQCLEEERSILQSDTVMSIASSDKSNILHPDVVLRQRILIVQDNVKSSEEKLPHMQLLRDSIFSNSTKLKEYEKEHHAEELPASERQQRILQTINKLKDTITHEKNDLQNRHKQRVKVFQEIVTEMGNVTEEVVDQHLNKWKVYQKYPALELIKSTEGSISLDAFQELFCQIFQLSVQIKQAMTTYYQFVEFTSSSCKIRLWESTGHDFSEIIQSLINRANDSIQKLLHNSVVIMVQPPQIIKIETKSGKSRNMKVVLRGLLQNPYVSYGEVKTEFRCEQDLRNDVQSSVKVKGGTGKLLYNQRVSGIQLTFESLHLENFQRAGKDDVVTEQKYGFIFRTEVCLGKQVMPIQVISLPIIVCCHTSQESSARASIFWWNAFSQVDAKPFEVDSRIQWDQLLQILSLELQSQTSPDSSTLGKSLNEANALCFAKLLQVDPSDLGALVSKERVCRDPMPPKGKFSFWKWFLAVINLIRRHLPNVWNDGLIEGFLLKEQAEEMLMKTKRPGTFILRFPTTYIDKMSVTAAGLSVVLLIQQPDGELGCVHCQPFTSNKHLTHVAENDFGSMLKEFRVGGHYKLEYLYPDRPIDEAFEKYMSYPEEDQADASYKTIITVFKTITIKDVRLSRPSVSDSVGSPSPSQGSQMDIDQAFSPGSSAPCLTPRSNLEFEGRNTQNEALQPSDAVQPLPPVQVLPAEGVQASFHGFPDHSEPALSSIGNMLDGDLGSAGASWLQPSDSDITLRNFNIPDIDQLLWEDFSACPGSVKIPV